MKDHIPTLAMLAALTMMLAAIVFLCISGLKPDTPVLIGLVGGVTGMAGAIGGFSMNSSNGKPPQQQNTETRVVTEPDGRKTETASIQATGEVKDTAK